MRLVKVNLILGTFSRSFVYLVYSNKMKRVMLNQTDIFFLKPPPNTACIAGEPFLQTFSCNPGRNLEDCNKFKKRFAFIWLVRFRRLSNILFSCPYFRYFHCLKIDYFRLRIFNFNFYFTIHGKGKKI